MPSKRPEKINSYLEPLIIPIADLKKNPENPRQHDQRSIDAIAHSFEKYGQQRPVVVNEKNVVIAGNGMYLAACKLGWKKIAAIQFDSKSRVSQLGFAIADNRTAELSTWYPSEADGQIAELEKDDPSAVDPVMWTEEEIKDLGKQEEKNRKEDPPKKEGPGEGPTCRKCGASLECPDC